MVMSFMFLFASFADATSVFDGESLVVIEISKLLNSRTLSDEIHVYNYTNMPNISAEIRGYQESKNQWVSLGKVNLKRIGDDDEIEKSLKKYSKFSVKPTSNEPIKVAARILNKYLYIFLLSEGTVDNSAFIFDIENIHGNIRGNFKENVRFQSQTNDEKIAFDLYARKSEDDNWQKVASAYLKKFKDTDTQIPAFTDSMEKYRYFAVVAQNGKQYRYVVKKENNDLYITVFTK